jgi:ssDNA-specific exonuclease RecJ
VLKEIFGTDGGSDWGLDTTAWCGTSRFVLLSSITRIQEFWKVIWVEDMTNTSKICIRKAEGTRLLWCSKQKNIITLSHKAKWHQHLDWINKKKDDVKLWVVADSTEHWRSQAVSSRRENIYFQELQQLCNYSTLHSTTCKIWSLTATLLKTQAFLILHSVLQLVDKLDSEGRGPVIL